MKPGQRFHFFFALLLLTMLQTGCSAPKALEYKTFNNLTVTKFGFSSSTLQMSLVYYNPNDFGLELESSAFDVFINNTFIGRTSQQTPISIPRRAEFVIPITIDVDMNNLLKGGLATFSSNEVAVKVDGVARIGKLNVYKNLPIHFEGKQAFTFF